jgi:hypothetical protein
MQTFKFATIVSLFRYVYLEYIHDSIYTHTNGYVNGYLLIALLLCLFKVPVHLILAVVAGRVVYRKIVGEEIVNVSNHPFNVIAFFIMLIIIRSV